MNSQRLDPLLHRARDKENAAAKDLAEKANALLQQEQRLDDLLRYADEYVLSAAGVTSAATLLNRVAFRERIDEAMTRQAHAVEKGRANCELERARLVLAGRDKKVIEKLAAVYDQAAFRQEQKKEQHNMDECAARLFRKKHQGEDAV